MQLHAVSPLRRQPFQGKRLELVIGIDVGTTFSGVSYAVLRPGEVPNVKPVTKFSGQTFTDSKIPSVIFYSEEGRVAAIGAETLKDEVESDAYEYGWTKVQYFKMHLRPVGMELNTNGLELGELPPDISAEKVMGDYLKYLYSEAETFIKDTHTDGIDIWRETQGRINFVLAHPNGWTGICQQKMRKSAILGKLIPETEDGRRRLTFITEGEASALACLSGGLGPSKLVSGFQFVVADAGGGTLDMSSYRVRRTGPIELEETTCPDCRFAGSIFVNGEAKLLLTRKLKGTKYDDPETLSDIVKEFDNKAKKEYDGEMEYGLVKVGGRRERNAELGIQNGFMKLSNGDFSGCFAFSCSEAVQSIEKQLRGGGGGRTPVWLVGGFGNSPYLLRMLREAFEYRGSTVSCPNNILSKAVANGAVLHFLDRSVKSRLSKASYGTMFYTTYSPILSEHRERKHLAHFDFVTGQVDIGPLFACLVEKGAKVDMELISTDSFSRTVTSRRDAEEFKTDIYRFDGDGIAPKWYLENKDQFAKHCTISADLSELCTDQTMMESLGVIRYWRAEFDIEIKLGEVELEARVKWDVEGTTKYGPATIIYEE